MILSQEELKTAKMQQDMQFHDYLKKFLGRHQLSRQEYSRAASGLLFLVDRECFFEETREKLRGLLVSGDVLVPSYQGDMVRSGDSGVGCKSKMK